MDKMATLAEKPAGSVSIAEVKVGSAVHINNPAASWQRRDWSKWGGWDNGIGWRDGWRNGW